MEWKTFFQFKRCLLDNRYMAKLELATHQQFLRYRYTFQGAILNAYPQHRSVRSSSQL